MSGGTGQQPALPFTAGMPARRVLVSWSTGKDSAWMLHVLRRDPDVSVGALVTTFNDEAGRVAMHGVRSELARAQAEAAGLPLWEIPLPWVCSNEEYDRRMRGIVARALAEGFTDIAFGDVFLEDVRRYREDRLARSGLRPIFPLWGATSRALADEMIAAGLRAIVTCVDPRLVSGDIAGRPFDRSLLAALPPAADPCGEHGEFHTFAWDGPMFGRPVPVVPGEVVERDGFVFADLLPATIPGD
jgi:uncharacterized protein (TIGR00290 family)